LLLLFRRRRPGVPAAAPRLHLPVRARGTGPSRRIGAERTPQRFCRVSRGAERGLDVREEHAESARVDVSAAAPGAQRRGAAVLPVAGPGPDGALREDRRAAWAAGRVPPARRGATAPARDAVGASPVARARPARAVRRPLPLTTSSSFW